MNKEKIIYRLFLDCGHEEFAEGVMSDAFCKHCDKLVKTVDAESSVDSFHRTILEFEKCH